MISFFSLNRRHIWTVSLVLLGAMTFELSFGVFDVHRNTSRVTLYTRNEEISNHALNSNQGSNFLVEDAENDVDDNRLWPSPRLLGQIAVDNTVIMISVNCGYVNMAQNWILHVQQLNITNYIVIALDDSVFPVLDAFAPGHVVMLNRDIATEVGGKAFRFDSLGFYKIGKQRPHMIQSILDQGYRVLYSDIDVVWVKNPFKRLPSHFDVVATVDDDVKPSEEIRSMCSCMIYLKPNRNVTNMMSFWASLMVSDSTKEGLDQDYWRKTLWKLKGTYSLHILDKYEFPPGFMFFDAPAKRRPNGVNLTREHVYTAHANWIVGYANKIEALKKKDLWLVHEGNALRCNSSTH